MCENKFSREYECFENCLVRVLAWGKNVCVTTRRRPGTGLGFRGETGEKHYRKGGKPKRSGRVTCPADRQLSGVIDHDDGDDISNHRRFRGKMIRIDVDDPIELK